MITEKIVQIENETVVGINIFNKDESILIKKDIPLKIQDISLFKSIATNELKKIINGRFKSDDSDIQLFLFHKESPSITPIDPLNVEVFTSKDIGDIKMFIEKSKSELIKKRKMDAMSTIVIQTILSHFNGDECEFFSRSRKRNVIIQRQFAMKIMHENELCPTLEWIGSVLKRDHATVIHGIKTITTQMDYDKKLLQDYNNTLSKVNTKLFTVNIIK